MAEIQPPAPPPSVGEAPAPAAAAAASSVVPHQKRGPSIHQIYALPAPIRTFPLPTFYPNNPVSLFHIAYAWLGQVLQPPPREPVVIHHGVWSETTISVHVTDEKSMRALWEQGFYGKGNLSRSEPNWLKREQVRRGLQEGHVSEILTAQRREERAQAKWERARLEQEIIRQTRLEETLRNEARNIAESGVGKVVAHPPSFSAPTGPLELLGLPNSAAELAKSSSMKSNSGESIVMNELPDHHSTSTKSNLIPKIDGESSPQTNGIGRLDTVGAKHISHDGSPADLVEPRTPIDNGVTDDLKAEQSPASSDGSETKTLKRQKSVRFSPTVESATYKVSDPPSPKRSPPVKLSQPSQVNGGNSMATLDIPAPTLLANTSVSDPIINKEHLQLMPEEVFFLSFGLGVLTVTDPTSERALSSKELFTLFRQHSYFPPRNGPDDPDLQPDDGFLLHYAVYHHFRSLGWVPRAGIKFGVDWLLYTRGPVFDHAEFGLIVVPSYSDPRWKAAGKKGPQKSWAWLHSVVRVLSHVTKSLVLIYVDVPPPSKFEEALNNGITEAMKLYKVREVMVKRWSSNRNR